MSSALQRTLVLTARSLVRANQTSSTSQSSIPNVKGLSSNVVSVPNEEVGPGAAKSSNYKNPEYFCYNSTSYFEAEVEMLKFRLPQPSNKK